MLRVVLLGASNLKIGFPRVLARLRGSAPEPVEVLAALGHGRSYGTWSRLAWVRLLPGIVQCGLWEELERRPPLQTVALVTDVGNDLLYGVPVPTIAGWVGTCLERLARQEAEIIVALLPLTTLENVSPVRYHLARQILFPGRRAAPWSAVLESARELNERLRRLGLEHGARLVEPSPSWYGIDPIHVRRSMRSQAWNQMLDHPLLPRGGQLAGGGRLPLFGSAELRLFGVPLRNPQPVCRFKDGSTVALY
ncbi:MAG TPA: hypothetical protein VNM67_14860 [Thermoanaerobaculia bacterium]|nr:hypothetical protein [Thermoanaerobaculia bacterium]